MPRHAIRLEDKQTIKVIRIQVNRIEMTLTDGPQSVVARMDDTDAMVIVNAIIWALIGAAE